MDISRVHISKIIRRLFLVWGATFNILLIISACNQTTRTINRVNDNEENDRYLLYEVGWPPIGVVFWSPSGNELLFNTMAENLNYSTVNTYNVESKEIQTIIDTSDTYGIIDIEGWSPDGQSILINSYGADFIDEGLWIYDVSDEKPPKLISTVSSAAWSKDGDIAIARKGFIYLLDRELISEKNIFQRLHSKINSLSWSPDGNKIAFSISTTLDNSNWEIVVIDIESGETTDLNVGDSIYFPSWSPVTDIIAFVELRQINGSISKSLFIVNEDGTCKTVVPTEGIERAPAWSPDGKKIAYVGILGIYMVDLTTVFGDEFPNGDILCSNN